MNLHVAVVNSACLMCSCVGKCETALSSVCLTLRTLMSSAGGAICSDSLRERCNVSVA